MWGFGGRYYWGRKGKKREGIVVIFAWMSSQERHVKSYVQLYSSLGWDSLICHSQFLNLFFPEKAEALASDILRELLEELKLRPSPVVFASFSGGPKACMYKVLQIIEAKCVVTLNLDDCKLVRDCLAGFIFDSSPVDFISDLGRRFAVHPSVTGVSNPPRIFSWIANGISNSLDAMFLSKFESQRAEYWQTLYSSVCMRAPYLILCSDNDELASYQVICNFTQRLRELGGDVKLVTMNGSPHVGHYRLYPIDYQAAVTGLLGKAAAVYSQRIQLLEGEKMGLEGSHDEKSKIGNLKKAIYSPDRSIRGATTSSTALYMPSSLEYYEGRDVGSVQDQQKEDLIHLSKLPSINAHGVLGQILFDVCVPRDVEGWDISSSASFNAPPHTFSRRHTPFNPIRCIRRSRL
ncbi:hypothetical protein K2173_028059 [Erythroxylum novogranatense]|uniref:DUF829 domain-containing protein n=1 Tax=Erythroxylum novogranatense TaxID=1862640 RepID=A0AAV8U0P7_9ROSI|nr:hypothetical protein K2173_028059 [Erythroxylum novogranatense]